MNTTQRPGDGRSVGPFATSSSTAATKRPFENGPCDALAPLCPKRRKRLGSASNSSISHSSDRDDTPPLDSLTAEALNHLVTQCVERENEKKLQSFERWRQENGNSLPLPGPFAHIYRLRWTRRSLPISPGPRFVFSVYECLSASRTNVDSQKSGDERR